MTHPYDGLVALSTQTDPYFSPKNGQPLIFHEQINKDSALQVRRHRVIFLKKISRVLTEEPELLWKGREVTELNTCMVASPYNRFDSWKGRGKKQNKTRHILPWLHSMLWGATLAQFVLWATAPGKEVCACMCGASRECC